MSNVTTEERGRERKKNEKRREERTGKISIFCFLRCLTESTASKWKRKYKGYNSRNPESSIQFLGLQTALLMRASLSCIVQLSETHCSDFSSYTSDVPLLITIPNTTQYKRQDYRNFCIYSRSLKGQCREDFAALDQFWAKIITLRLYSLTKCFCKVTTKISNEFYHRGLTIIKFLRIF